LTGGAPNYFPNSFSGPQDDTKYLEHMDNLKDGQVGRYNTADDDNFTQVGTFFNKVSVIS
jgi:catalase